MHKVKLCLDKRRDSAVIEEAEIRSTVTQTHEIQKKGGGKRAKAYKLKEQVETDRDTPQIKGDSPNTKFDSLGSSWESVCTSNLEYLRTENSVHSKDPNTDIDDLD